MSTRSSIEWTETTWNPATGCDRVSAGCDHCYALTLAKRLKAMGSAKYQTDGDPRTSGPGFGVATHEHALAASYRWRDPRLVFVNSMIDLFHARGPTQFVHQVFEVMAVTPRHTYQLLTNVRPGFAGSPRSCRGHRTSGWVSQSRTPPRSAGSRTSVRCPPRSDSCPASPSSVHSLDSISPGISWVIVGGESGTDARPVQPAWITELRDTCAAAEVPFFFKLLCTNLVLSARERLHSVGHQ